MTNVNEIIQEAVAAVQAAEQQAPATQQAAGNLGPAFAAAAPLLKGLDVLKSKSARAGIFGHKFDYEAKEKGDHVRITTTVQFYKSKKAALSVNVYNGGNMTVLFNDPGSYKGGAINNSSEVIDIVAKGAVKNGFIR